MIVPPEPIEATAMLPDHPPAMFVWRGERHRVAQADGPERLHGEWWRERGHEAEVPHAIRDYFQVETTAGKRYWLFRLGDGEHAATGSMTWFIHGAFA
jgi:protein ImuB